MDQLFSQYLNKKPLPKTVILNEPLYFLTAHCSFEFLQTKSRQIYNIHFCSNAQPFLCVLSQKIDLRQLCYFGDIYSFDVAYSQGLYLTLVYFFTNKSINFVFLPQKLVFDSSSTVLPSAQWPERELKEFSNFYIFGLTDTRRLLTDYLQNTTRTEDVYYDLILQEVF